MKIHKKLKNIIVGGLLLSLLSGCGTAGQVENVVGNTNLNLFNRGTAAEQGNKVYFEKNGKLFSLNADGSNEKELADCSYLCPNINVVGEWIYFYDERGDYKDNTKESGIYRIKTNGQDEEKIISLNTWYTSLVVADDMIYYFDEDGLYKSDTTGKNITALVLTDDIHTNVYDRRVYLYPDNQKLMFCMNIDTDEYLHQDYYVVDIDGSDLQPITSVLPEVNWSNVWNNRNGDVHMVPISNEWIMIDDTCYDWEGNYVFSVYREGFDYFNYYDGYIFFTAPNSYWVNEDAEDCLFIFNSETESSFVVQNLESTFEADGGGEMLCLAGNNLFFYTEVDADPELIDGQWVQGSIHSLQILDKETLDSYVKRMEEEDISTDELAVQ